MHLCNVNQQSFFLLLHWYLFMHVEIMITGSSSMKTFAINTFSLEHLCLIVWFRKVKLSSFSKLKISSSLALAVKELGWGAGVRDKGSWQSLQYTSRHCTRLKSNMENIMRMSSDACVKFKRGGKFLALDKHCFVGNALFVAIIVKRK